MLSPGNLNGRISPDITSLSFSTNFSSSLNPVVNPVNNSGANGNNNGLNSISEVPPGLYEFIVGSNGEVKILCKICQYMSNKKSNFKRHFTNMHFVHSEDASKMLECCGIRYVHHLNFKCTYLYEILNIRLCSCS